MTDPVWWPELLAATRRRREYTADLLAHATPIVDGDRLRLEFADPQTAAAWEESGAQAALEGALQNDGRKMAVHVEISS